jgi:hypothetical protein
MRGNVMEKVGGTVLPLLHVNVCEHEREDQTSMLIVFDLHRFNLIEAKRQDKAIKFVLNKLFKSASHYKQTNQIQPA